MKSHVNPAGTLQASDRFREIAPCIERYEDLAHEDLPDLRRILDEVAPDFRPLAAIELVRMDMEHRWKRHRGAAKTFAQYLEEMPELQLRRASHDELRALEDELRNDLGNTVSAGDSPCGASKTKTSTVPDTNSGTSTSDTVPLATKTHLVETLRPSAKYIGPYEVRAKIGQGSFGSVYRCYDSKLDRQVAVKVLSDEAAADHEGRSIAEIKHSNIVPAYDRGTSADNEPYIVYAYIDGKSLADRIEANDYDLDQAVKWIIELAGAVHAAHRRNVIHRDIKPANILIDSDNHPHLTDFGLARRDDRFFKREKGALIGTLSYMSPEQIDRPDWASRYADIYSLGVVFYELLTGRLPFRSDDWHGLCEQIKNRAPDAPVTRKKQDLSQPIRTVCLKAIAKDPLRRHQTAGEFADALKRAINPRRSATDKLLMGSFCAVAVLLAVLFMFWPTAPSPQQTTSPAPAPLSEIEFQVPRIQSRPIGEQQLRAVPLGGLPRPAEELLFQVRLVAGQEPTYLYIVAFTEAGAEILSPKGLGTQRRATACRFPARGSDDDWYQLPNEPGAMLILFAASREPIELTELAGWQLPPEVFVGTTLDFVLKNGPPSHVLIRDHWTVMSGDASPIRVQKGQIPKQFEDRLADIFDEYFAALLPFTPTETSAE